MSLLREHAIISSRQVNCCCEGTNEGETEGERGEGSWGKEGGSEEVELEKNEDLEGVGLLGQGER